MGYPSVILSAAAQKQYDMLSKAFDARDYAKAIRHADLVLATHAGHGETTAMKGLCTHTLGDHAEGHALVKEALGYNMKSSLIWHCLGLCYKAEKNMTEAMKAFKQSARLEPTNLNALRDVSTGAIQTGDWESLVEARQGLVSGRNNVRAHWIGLACAHRLAGNLELSAQVLEVMIKLMGAGDNDMEKSEVHLFRAELEIVQKRPTRVLEILKHNEKEITDASEKSFLRAKAMCMLNQKDGAEKIIFDLINKGISESDCAVMLAGLRGIEMDGVNLGSLYCAPYTRAKCLPLRHYLHETNEATKANNDLFVAMLDDIVASATNNTYNSSSNSNPVRCWEGAKRLALDCVTDIEAYKTRLSEFLKPYILRTIPAVISILKSIYQYYPLDSVRVTSIGDLLLKWEAEAEAGTFAPQANPMHILWLWQALSAHYMRVGDFAKATEYVDKAIAHTPTMEQLYLLKAKICRRDSRLLEAAELAEKARVMDLQDRYLNVKAVKYWLRVGDVERAENVFQLFLKASENPHDAYLTAYDTQCTWFQRELGDAFFNPSASYDVGAEMVYGEKALLTRPRALQKNSSDVISALQNYVMFEHHHQDNHEELLDFHNYTFRRCNLRQFVDVQLTNHNLATQSMFLRVCPKMVRALMKVAVDGLDATKSRHVSRPPPNDHPSLLEQVPLEDPEKEKERVDTNKSRGEWYNNYYHKDIADDLEEPLKRARPYVDALLTFQGALPSNLELAIEYFLLCQEKEGGGYSVPLLKALKALKAIANDEATMTMPVEMGANGWGLVGTGLHGGGLNLTLGGAKVGGLKYNHKYPAPINAPGSYINTQTTTTTAAFPSSTTCAERELAKKAYSTLLERFTQAWTGTHKGKAHEVVVSTVEEALAAL